MYNEKKEERNKLNILLCFMIREYRYDDHVNGSIEFVVVLLFFKIYWNIICVRLVDMGNYFIIIVCLVGFVVSGFKFVAIKNIGILCFITLYN